MRTLARTAPLLAGLCFAHVFAPAWPAATEAPELLRIGLLLPPEETEGPSLRHGAELGLEFAQRALADTGSTATLDLIVRGRPGQWGDDGTEAARMVLDDEARALIAPPGGAPTHLVLQVAGRTSVPIASLCGDTSVTSAGVPWMMRLPPRTSEEAATLFSHLASPPLAPARTWLAFVPTDRAGREATHDLQRAATTAGVVIRRFLEVNPNLADPTALAQNALAHQPDALLLWLDPQPAGRLAAALRQRHFAGPLAGPGRLRSPAFLDAAGPAADGFLLAAPRVTGASVDLSHRFARAYRERHRHEPDATAALTFDAVRLLAEILRRAGSGFPRQQFPLRFEMPGATGPLAFDRNGNRQMQLGLLQARAGSFRPLAPATPGTEGQP